MIFDWNNTLKKKSDIKDTTNFDMLTRNKKAIKEFIYYWYTLLVSKIYLLIVLVPEISNESFSS